MEFPFGFECQLLHYDSARTAYTSGALTGVTQVELVRDATLTAEATAGDVSHRGSAFKRTKAGLKGYKLEGEILWNPDDDQFNFLRTAFENRTTYPAVALDGSPSTAGSSGMAADWAVTGFSRQENLDAPVTARFTLEVGLDVNPAVPPEWITITT